MFEKKAAVFLYTTSPVHVGAGTAMGLIDNPIQRERHTAHPSFAGSGIKGALRHGWAALGGDSGQGHIDRLFGPATNSGETHAGAISFGDAQLVCMPVRSVRRGYAMVASSHSLARAARQLQLSDAKVDWGPVEVSPGAAKVSGKQLLRNSELHLESFQYAAEVDNAVESIALSLAEMAVPASTGFDFFRNKIAEDLVVLSDEDFAYFAEHSMLVEPHVRINEETGAASDGGL